MINTAALEKSVPAELLAGLVEGLAAERVLTAEWRAVFLAVPRHLFVPDLVWRSGEGGRSAEPILRSDQPDAWLKVVYQDAPVITQINDGAAPAAGVLTEC